MLYNDFMRTILITGASGGIGSEIAKKFANSKNNVILVYNKNKKMIQTLKQGFKNCNLEIFQCDLTQTDQINSMVAKIIKTYKKIDCLVNCAGISKSQLIQDTTVKDYYDVFDTNLKSTIMLTSAVAKHMISEQNGKIVNISSVSTFGNIGQCNYSAAKCAIEGFTRTLAMESGRKNITVNCISPGMVDTDILKTIPEETLKMRIQNSPCQRLGSTDEIASVAAFLCSDDSAWVTGNTVLVCGGARMRA